jgi:hypothetical protein
VFLQLTSIGLFGENRAHLHLETPRLQGVFLEKLTQYSQGNNVLDPPAFTQMVVFGENMCFFNSAE